MTVATRKYANGQQKDKKWRQRHNLVASPRANFHYPRASIKARERSEMKSKFIQQKLAVALAAVDRINRLKVEADRVAE